MKILVIEDEEDAREILQIYLEAKGHQVILASDGVAGLRQFAEAEPQVVLLDLMMPRLDGWEVLSAIRAQSDRPVLMLTAKDGTEDVVRALAAGVDDYIVKPFKLREVEARIEAVWRRCHPGTVLRSGELVLDDAKKEVHLGKRLIVLSPREYQLLKLLASEPGRVFSDTQIVRQVWPEGSLASSGDVKRYIHLLRRKVELDPPHPRLVLTVRGFGYKLGQ